MAECQNFFDHPSPGQCQSGSSTDQLPPASQSEYADQGLELRLGPSVDVNEPKHHEMVRPIPIYPSMDRQRSGNLTQMIENATLFRGHSDVAMADKALFSKVSAFTTPPHISREQVWQTLQKSKDVLCHEDVCTGKALGDDGALLGRSKRAASMQIVMPSGQVSEADASPIQRSCSNGILLSRQSSLTQEASVDKSPDQTGLSLFGQQHGGNELRMKRELQAHRRREAWKRRRLLLEAKQQTKVRQNSGSISRHGAPKQEKATVARTRSMDHAWALQHRPSSHNEDLCVAPGEVDDMNGGTLDRNSAQCDQFPTIRGMLRKPSFDKHHDYALADLEKMMMCKGYDNSLGDSWTTMTHMECDSNSGSSKLIQGDPIVAVSRGHNMVASQGLSLHAVPGPSQVGKDGDAVEGVKCTPSSCSETESIEKRGRNPCKEMDSSERESSSQKSSTEDHIDCIGSTNVSHSKPMLYPRALPCSKSGIMEMHATRGFQSFANCTAVASVRNDGSQKRRSTSPVCKPSDANANTGTTGFAIRRSVGVFSEGKWKTADETPACLPIRRTTSHIVEASTDIQSSAKKLEACVTGAASQLKVARMGLADATFRSRTDASRENPLTHINRVYLQNTPVKMECDTYSAEEEPPIVTSKGEGRDKLRIADASRMGNARVKLEEEDMTGFHSHQESDSSNRHVGVLDRQRSVSFLDLPWVTTTGRGPNGKTIHGVMYITSGRAVRLVCRCHGRHMSPTEFVEHSGSSDLSNPLKSIVVSPSPFLNQVASTPL